MCTRMTTKTITIMNDVYELISSAKKRTESFSEFLRRKFGSERDIMRFAGAWEDVVSDKEAEKMKSKIRKLRKRSTKELLVEQQRLDKLRK